MDFLNDSPSLLTGNTEYAIALGNFDGMHLGHRCVIDTAKIKAQHFNCKSAVFTFWPHPNKVLINKQFNEILSLQEKTSMIKEMGIDEVFIINFTSDFSKTTAEEFINHLCQKFKIQSITTGYNFRFGNNRHGNIETLNRLKRHYGFEYNAINQIFIDDSIVSSSILRKFLQIGCVNLFSKFTGKKYTIDCKLLIPNYSEMFNIFKANNNQSVFASITNDKNIILPTFATYLGQVQEDYFCLFIEDNRKVFLVPIDARPLKLADDFKVNVLQIISQYKYLDKYSENELLIKDRIKKTIQYLKIINKL